VGLLSEAQEITWRKIEQNKATNSLTVVHYTCSESPNRKKTELAPYKGCSLNNPSIFREE